MTKYIFLVIVVCISFFAMTQFGYYFNHKNPNSLFLRFIFIWPGILFSFFLIILQSENYSKLKLLAFFVLLNIIYIASFFCGLSSWGGGLPFIGGAGAFLINFLFYYGMKDLEFYNKVHLASGFVSGGVGLVLFLVVPEETRFLYGFGLIISLWQLVFGIIWIKQIDYYQKIRTVKLESK